MELDIQRFMQNPDQQQFEFQHLPTSYLRCAAHRVAQHFGLHTMALENAVDGLGNRVVAKKTPDSKFPAVCLSELPAKVSENEIIEQVKIAIRPRPKIASPGDADHLGAKRSATRTVEKRKEEYDKARARIFSGSSSPEVGGASPPISVDGGSLFLSRDVESQKTVEEFEKTNSKYGASRMAIFRDREKDRIDPDYDRSYERCIINLRFFRYVRGLPPSQNFSMPTYSIFQPAYLSYDGSISLFGHLPMDQNNLNYNMHDPTVNAYVVGCDEKIKDAVYVQWPSPTMMNSNSIYQVIQLMCNIHLDNLINFCQYKRFLIRCLTHAGPILLATWEFPAHSELLVGVVTAGVEFGGRCRRRRRRRGVPLEFGYGRRKEEAAEEAKEVEEGKASC
ncbi:hypothetical protein BHE74_00014906 [Ensete ventricosum]|nr:hypothetical protein BHE74_00014906 [Ensete ventricosum]